jgi:protein-disulfide isomerase/uncharacterized membrane protein
MRIFSVGVDTPGKRGLAATLLSAIGTVNAAVLAHIHYKTHTDDTFESFCSFSKGFSCDAVAAGDYSNFLGLPVAVWGLVGYLALGLAGIWLAATRNEERRRAAAGTLFLLSAGAMLASAVLMTVSVVFIESVCPLCTLTHGINTGIAAFAFFAARRTGGIVKTALAAPRFFFSRPAVLAPVAAISAVLVTVLQIAVPSYWRTEVRYFGPEKLCVGTTEKGDHWIGAEEPCLTIVEFSDYECGHCRARHAEMRDLVAGNPDKVRLVHCQYPLDQKCNPDVPVPFHKSACDKACMAVCAGEQGAFWEANDFLFSHKGSLPDAGELAETLNIDAEEFARCLASDKPKQSLGRDLASAREIGVQATPTFFVNGALYKGRVPKSVIAKALDKALDKASGSKHPSADQPG